MSENLKESESVVIKQARDYVGQRGIGSDSINIFMNVAAMLEDVNKWATINQTPTYEEYVRNQKAKNNKRFADTIMRFSNSDLVRELDDVVQQINREIGLGVTTQEQADEIKKLLIKAQGIVYGA